MIGCHPVRVPKFHPALGEITADEEGRMYVQSWERTEKMNGYYYDIFDPEGRYVAKIPLHFSPTVWKNGKVYAIEVDESGFQVVKRYKVHGDVDWIYY